MEALEPIVGLLVTKGPWAIVAILGWALYKKDQQQQTERREAMQLAIGLSESITKLEGAVNGMGQVLQVIAASKLKD